MPSTITAPVLTASSSLVDDKGHVLLSSPTLQAIPVSNVGSIVGGAVGGALFLLLVLSLVGVCYLRKQQTFHGNYYTKQYLGTNDLQKASTQHELHPTKAGSQQDHDREEWGDRQLKEKRERRNRSNYHGDDYPSNGYTRAMRESGQQQHNQQREHLPCPSARQARGGRHPVAKPLENCSPYLSDDCYDSGPEGDYVAHTDGSVISRREWYVWQAADLNQNISYRASGVNTFSLCMCTSLSL